MLSITPNFAQERGLNLLRRKWKQKRTFMMYAPTGSGKTGLAAFIAAGHVARGLRVMFVAPFTVLVTQTVQRFVGYGLPEDEISILWRNHPEYHPERLIQIASADTLIRRDFPDNIDLLIIDEAHMKKRAMLEWIRDAEFRVVGLSGTPFSPWLGKYYEELIKPTTISELIQRGDLSQYEFYAPTKPDLKGVKTANTADYGRDYNEKQLAEVMCGSDLVGDIVDNWLRNGQDLPTVAFCVDKAHANYVTMQFVKVGVNAEVMVAETPHEERQLMIHRFETGATKIIVSVGVLVAGFDSDVRCVIYARPTKSEIRWLQALGRGLRTAPGKEACIARDTLILTDKGDVKIQDVTLNHKVWDGISFVEHNGAFSKGLQKTIEYCGVVATPDHEVLTNEGWKKFEEATHRRLWIAVAGACGESIRFADNNLTEDSRERVEPESGGMLPAMRVRIFAPVPQYEEATGNESVSAMSPLSGYSSGNTHLALQAMPGAGTTLQQPQSNKLRKLWWTRDSVQFQESKRCSPMDCRQYRNTEFAQYGSGQDQQQRELRTGQSSLGTESYKFKQQACEQKHQATLLSIQKQFPGCEIRRCDIKENDSFWYIRPGHSEALEYPLKQTEREVWDIHNAGQFRRFTANGLIVHNCLIFDHSGTVHLLGFPDAIEYNELPSKNDGMKETAARQAEEREEKLPKECPECHFMKPAGVYVCPKCGFKPLVGEDVETDTQRNIKKLSKGGKVYTKSDKQSWWSQIKFYQRQRTSMGKPISDGWCAHTYREKFNEWPNGLSNFPVEITPEVNNYIRHKLIKFAKGKEKPAEKSEVSPANSDAGTTSRIINAKRQVENIRSTLGRRTA